MYVSVQMIDQIQPTETNDQLLDMGNHGMFMKARLAPGVSIAQVRTAAGSFTAEMQRRFPSYWPGTSSLVAIPESDIAVNPLLDSVIVPAAAALMAVVGLVLLVACANLASFLLAQARDRQREIAIRLAIGASRRSLIRQLLAESLVLSAIGGIAGVLLSRVALGALLTAGLLFGLLPALQATRAAVIETIKNENTGGPARRFTVRSALVVGQVAVSLLLLITASLFLRSLQARANIDPGFGKTPAGMVWFAVPTDRYDAQRRLLLIDEIEKRVREIPGVTSVGVTGNILLNTLTQQDRTVNVEGFVPPKGQLGFVVDAAAADSGYFEAAGVKILRGRPFTAADAPGAPHVAVINEVMANTFWAGQDPVGRTFRVDTAIYRVVGVSRTTKVRSLGEAPRPFLFTSFRQEFSANVMLVAGTRGDADRTAVQMLAALRAVDPSLMVVQAKTMARHLATMVLPAQLGAIAFALFAGLALLLALIGVYGVVSYAVARRTREVGIRLAVGAQPNAVIRLLMREGTVLVAIGGAVGLVLGIAMARALASLLYGVALTDPLTFIGAPLLLFAVGVLAAFIPARRASRIDPAGVLRAE
jgi:predicted permease